MQNSKHIFKHLTLVILVIISLVLITSSPVLGASNGSTIELCDSGSNNSTPEFATSIQLVFQLLRLLGPLVGTLVFVAYSLAGSAQVKNDYQSERRKAVILGFSVPVAIVFLEVVAREVLLRGQGDISCFFP